MLDEHENTEEIRALKRKYGKKNNMLLGEKIKNKRREAKLTLQELAEKIDCSRSYLWEIENNRNNRNPSDVILEKISEALHVSFDFLKDPNKTQTQDEIDSSSFYRNFKKLTEEQKKVIEMTMKAWGKQNETNQEIGE